MLKMGGVKWCEINNLSSSFWLAMVRKAYGVAKNFYFFILQCKLFNIKIKFICSFVMWLADKSYRQFFALPPIKS